VRIRKSQIRVVISLLVLVILTLPIFGIPPNSSVIDAGGGSVATLTGEIFDSLGPDEDSDGFSDYLNVGVEVNVTESGVFIVSVDSLLDSNYSDISVYDSQSAFLSVGLQIIYLHLDGEMIYASKLNPAMVSYVSLYNENYEYLDSMSSLPLSKEYLYTEFDRPPAVLTGKVYDRGLDTDDDGTFDYLEVSVEVNVTKPGLYDVFISGLFEITPEGYRYYIDVWGSASGYLDIGLGMLNVSFYGPAIYASNFNPTNVSWISFYSADPYRFLGSLNEVPLSRKYLYTEFDVPIVIVGIVSDQGVDNDADGYFDFLEIDVQVNVSDSGTYSLFVSGLSDQTHTRSVWDVRDSKTIFLDKGIHTEKFYFYGPSIYAAKCNPTIVLYMSVSWQYDYRTLYDSRNDVPLTKQYYYTQFEAPFTDVETKFIVYPDGRVSVEGSAKSTNMVPQYRGPTGQGSFNLTSTQATADLTVNLPPEMMSQFPFNSTTADLLAEYSSGLLNLGINSTIVLPPVLASQYPFNSTDGKVNVTYSGGILNVNIEGNTTLPPLTSKQFPFDTTDITVVGAYTPNTLKGRITFSVLDSFTFDDVNVDFTGTQTDLTLNGTVHVVFNLPLGDFVIRNETELIQMIDQLKSTLIGENGAVWNLTGGLLNVTSLDVSYTLNGIGATVTFKMDVQGDFVQALTYVMSGGRNYTLLSPVLNEAYQSVQSGSFDIQYWHSTSKGSIKLTLSYNLEHLINYVLTPPTGTTPYIMTSYDMSPTIYLGDVVLVEAVNATDVVADPDTGDIIALKYPSDPRYIVIHRAINKTQVGGTWYFQTKGDANASPDNWVGNYTYNGMISEYYLIGKVSSRIPYLGFVLAYPYSLYYYMYYDPYLQSTVAPRMALLKAVFSSVQSMTVQVSYSSTNKQFDLQLALVDKSKALIDEITKILPELLPPETPSELKEFVESFLNATYASISSAQISFSYENGKADLKATASIEGDLNAQLNYLKDLYFRALSYPVGYDIPWQVAFLNQTKIDVSNFRISARLDETSFEGRIEGLTLMPPKDVINATHFKLERLFNLTAPQYPSQREFPEEYQRLRITIEGGSNATHMVTLFRPSTVPEPNLTARFGKSMVWFNQTLSSLKDLVFKIEPQEILFDAGTWNGIPYNVGVISNSTVSDFYFNPVEGAFLRFNVTGEDAGYCKVAIPKDILWTENGWIVLVDDEPVVPTVTEEGNDTYLYFTYSGGTKTVEILGTNVVPEFPSAVIMPLLLILTLLALVVSKKKHRGRKQIQRGFEDLPRSQKTFDNVK